MTDAEKEEAESTFAKLALEGEWYALQNGYLRPGHFPDGHELQHYARQALARFRDAEDALEELRDRAELYGVDSDPDI